LTLSALDYIRQSEYSWGVLKTTRIDPEELIQALAEPTRLRLLSLLLAGETCVCHLTDALRIPQPTASRHLARLRKAGLVTVRRDGLWAYYALAPAKSAAHAKLLECLEAFHEEIAELAANSARCRKLRGKPDCC
jgi:ArsR family transcriptional regulator